MKLKTLGITVALAIGSIGIANAVPTITNGDFSTATPPYSGPTQYGPGGGTVSLGSGTCTWGGQFVSGWTGNSGYGIWYSSASAASGTSACTQYGQGSSGNGTSQRLPSAVTAPPVGPGSFVGLDGQSGIGASISQNVTGLVAGNNYKVSFYWASTQEMSTGGSTTEHLHVSLGSQSFDTVTNSIPTHGFSGWALDSFTFTAGSGSNAGLLSFLSVGNPGLPPFALLTGVSITSVPEPPALAMFGGGLLGLGLLTLFARRRAQRRLDDGSDGSLA